MSLKGLIGMCLGIWCYHAADDAGRSPMWGLFAIVLYHAVYTLSGKLPIRSVMIEESCFDPLSPGGVIIFVLRVFVSALPVILLRSWLRRSAIVSTGSAES